MIQYIVMFAIASLIGLWTCRTYEHVRGRKLSLMVKCLAPLAGAILTLAFGGVIALAVFLLLVYLLDTLRMSLSTVWEIIFTSFISLLFLTPIHNRIGIMVDSRTPFWHWAIKELNVRRGRDHGIYLAKLGPLYIRDPHSHPMRTYWMFSKWHPFMCKRYTVMDLA